MGSYNTNKLADERGYGEMTEEINSQLQEAVAEKNKLAEQLAKLSEEATALRNEKRQNKISEYKKLCAEKKVSEKDLSKVSEETIDFLIEQVKDIKVSEEKKEMKSVVSESIPEVADSFMVERSMSGKGYAVWEMPNEAERQRLHKNLPFIKNR